MTVQLYLGDCLEFMKTLPDKSVDAVITDPPYGINVQNRNCAAKRKDNRSYEIIFWDVARQPQFYFDEINRISLVQIIWGANYFNCFGSNGSAIVWDKLQPLPDSSQCEIASYSNIRNRKVFKYTQRWTNFVNTKQTIHPTEKPVELMKWCIELATHEGDTIFDPFMGSGTTGVACVQTGRNFIGCEIDPQYFKIAEKRIKVAQQQLRLEGI